MAAEHPRVADLGIAIRAPKKIAQADDVITVTSHEEAVEQHRRALEDTSSERLQGRVLPIDMGFVRHVAPNGGVTPIELLTRVLAVDIGKRDRLDAVVAQAAPELIERAEVRRPRLLA